MEFENKNIIFTVPNVLLEIILTVIVLFSIFVTYLFFTVIDQEYIILSLPFVFSIFVLPIFMYGMRKKILIRFTKEEFQYRFKQNLRIKWADIESYNISGGNIAIKLKNGNENKLSSLKFNENELSDAFNIYLNAK